MRGEYLLTSPAKADIIPFWFSGNSFSTFEMLGRISFLVLLGCFLPSVLSRPPSVSLQNDGHGSYNFRYDVSHPKGSSRGHMRFGSTSKQQGGDQPSHLSPAPHDSYRAEKEVIRGSPPPQDYSDSSEALHDPRPIYPSPYDSSEKQNYDVPVSNYHSAPSAPHADYHPPQSAYEGSGYGGVPQPAHDRPIGYSGVQQSAHDGPAGYGGVQQSVHDGPAGYGSVQQSVHDGPAGYGSVQQSVHDGPAGYGGVQQSVHDGPAGYGGVQQSVHDGPAVYGGVKTAQPVAQVSVPAFSGHEEVKPVPVGPNYQFIPDGPPYVVNSHSTEIVHPPLPNDLLIQKPVELAAPVPSNPVLVQQPVELAPPHPVLPQQPVEVSPPHPVVPQQPVEVSPPHPVIPQQPLHLAPLPKESVYIQEPVELSQIPKLPVELSLPVVQQSVDLPQEPVPYVLPDVSAAAAVKQPPSLSLAFQLPVQKPAISGPKVDDVQLSHSYDSPSDPVLVNEPADLPHQPIDLSDDAHSPVSHSLRLPLLTPSPEISSGPSAAAIEAVPELAGHIGGGSSPPLSHSTRLLLPGPSASLGYGPNLLGPSGHGSLDEPVNSLGVDSSLNSAVGPPPSHAFRLTLPGVKPVGGPFTEVETPEAPQLPQLSHAFRLNLPSVSYGSVSNNPSVEYFPSEDASLLALESKL